MTNQAELIDAIKEIINIGVGRAAAILSEMLNKPIKLRVPSVSILNQEEIKDELKDILSIKLSLVKLEFNGAINGNSCLLFPTISANNLVKALTEDDSDTTEMDILKEGTLSEVGNIILNGIMGSVANMLSEHLVYSIPVYSEEALQAILINSNDRKIRKIILARTRFFVEDLEIIGDVLLIIEGPSLTQLKKLIDRI